MLLDEIIKRIHNLTPEQQKEVMEYLETMQQGQERSYSSIADSDPCSGSYLTVGNNMVKAVPFPGLLFTNMYPL